MRFLELMACLLLGLAVSTARAEDPPTPPAKVAPAEPAKAAPAEPVKKPAAAKQPKPAASDEEEPPPKTAPRRFVPTDKGKADEDIPFPVDI